MKEHFLLILFFVMNIIGIPAYFYGFDYYFRPSPNALYLVFFLGLAFYLGAAAGLLIFKKLPRKKSQIRLEQPVIAAGPRLSAGNLLWHIVTAVLLAYIVIHWRSFSLISLTTGLSIGESSRPDVVGNIPFYWSFTVLLSAFGIPLAVNEFIRQRHQKKWGVVWTTIVLFVFTFAMGDKSTVLIVVGYLIAMSMKINVKSLTFFSAIFILTYASFKYISLAGTVPFSDFISPSYLMESIFRRVSMVTVSGMGYIIENRMQIPDLLAHSEVSLKQVVFLGLYGYLPGGVPTPYIVYNFYHMPLFFMFAFVFLISAFLVVARGVILCWAPSRFFHAVLFLHFYGATLMVNNGLFDILVRSLIPAAIIVVVSMVNVNAQNASYRRKFKNPNSRLAT